MIIKSYSFYHDVSNFHDKLYYAEKDLELEGMLEVMAALQADKDIPETLPERTISYLTGEHDLVTLFKESMNDKEKHLAHHLGLELFLCSRHFSTYAREERAPAFEKFKPFFFLNFYDAETKQPLEFKALREALEKNPVAIESIREILDSFSYLINSLKHALTNEEMQALGVYQMEMEMRRFAADKLYEKASAAPDDNTFDAMMTESVQCLARVNDGNPEANQARLEALERRIYQCIPPEFANDEEKQATLRALFIDSLSSFGLQKLTSYNAFTDFEYEKTIFAFGDDLSKRRFNLPLCSAAGIELSAEDKKNGLSDEQQLCALQYLLLQDMQTTLKLPSIHRVSDMTAENMRQINILFKFTHMAVHFEKEMRDESKNDEEKIQIARDLCGAVGIGSDEGELPADINTLQAAFKYFALLQILPAHSTTPQLFQSHKLPNIDSLEELTSENQRLIEQAWNKVQKSFTSLALNETEMQYLDAVQARSDELKNAAMRSKHTPTH
jgi:hypothetical protein